MMLVIGAGVAGLSTALEAAALGAEVMLVTPGVLRVDAAAPSGAGLAEAVALGGGNTALAQGGIAAALGDTDSAQLHATDTVAAGVGLVDPRAARVLAAEGAAIVRAHITSGFAVDRTASGEVALGLEAAHSRPRIVHAGEDQSGAALHRYLCEAVLALVAAGRVQLTERAQVVSLLGDAGVVSGAVLRSFDGQLSAVRADNVVLASGGYASLYSESSNHAGARGEGIVLAARLGAVVADLEYVQFHPTVLAGTGFLISEAVRGAGAVLRDETGERFMTAAHEAAELAPRDVVSRTVYRNMRGSGAKQVWLDATEIERLSGGGTLARRFPLITRQLQERGIDWAREAVPVAPAAHYTMGGVATDLHGRTSVPGLFAAGEVACTGVHGANRLASNSLLEGLVFGTRAARAALKWSNSSARQTRPLGQHEWSFDGEGMTNLVSHAAQLPMRPDFAESDLQNDEGAELATAMSAGLGIEREATGISAVAKLAELHDGMAAELVSMMAAAALARTESRGAHQRADFPETDPAQATRQGWARRSTAVNYAPNTTSRSASVC
ncbi:FAD-binding protein [Leucobacter sp. UT-8R-CII-1-4]|uniref:L-aspartate oxidase n=1 Tax=Leucobacter sp. UT-8R-CII-1-4 TaxID=3040075 RepID=UPI0024A90934|nr:FAD-binding protein [Leucobacter sp. UT-8R-CII-1-4]MDI6022284.1 FAD-binding protein [Leucobacter sp. UT-8R-CII-1-4]